MYYWTIESLIAILSFGLDDYQLLVNEVFTLIE